MKGFHPEKGGEEEQLREKKTEFGSQETMNSKQGAANAQYSRIHAVRFDVGSSLASEIARIRLRQATARQERASYT
ncbi:MAG: hypothetical protein ACREF9_18220, partial [Opitutaceae bacterium]